VIKTVNDLEVYRLTIEFAMDVFEISKKFPVEEKFSLTDQIRRSSRSVAGNIAEGWGKRSYIKLLKRHLVDSAGSLEESKTWLLFSFNCFYIIEEEYNKLSKKVYVLGGKLNRLHTNWKDYKSTFKNESSDFIPLTSDLNNK
jgi:four helix bundle protein